MTLLSVESCFVCRIDLTVQIGKVKSFIRLRIIPRVFSTEVQRFFEISNATAVASLKAFSSSVMATMYLSLYLWFGVS